MNINHQSCLNKWKVPRAQNISSAKKIKIVEFKIYKWWKIKIFSVAYLLINWRSRLYKLGYPPHLELHSPHIIPCVQWTRQFISVQGSRSKNELRVNCPFGLGSQKACVCVCVGTRCRCRARSLGIMTVCWHRNGRSSRPARWANSKVRGN